MNDQYSMAELLNFLDQLDKASIFYTLANPTARAIMVNVVVPGEKWEIEFFEDRSVAIEVFQSPGKIYDIEKLEDLFQRFSD